MGNLLEQCFTSAKDCWGSVFDYFTVVSEKISSIFDNFDYNSVKVVFARMSQKIAGRSAYIVTLAVDAYGHVAEKCAQVHNLPIVQTCKATATNFYERYCSEVVGKMSACAMEVKESALKHCQKAKRSVASFAEQVGVAKYFAKDGFCSKFGDFAGFCQYFDRVLVYVPAVTFWKAN